MKKKIELVFILLVIFVNQGYINAQHLKDYVDPLIGSGGHGHVFVGAVVWIYNDHTTIKTMSSIQLLDVPGNAITCEILH